MVPYKSPSGARAAFAPRPVPSGRVALGVRPVGRSVRPGPLSGLVSGPAPLVPACGGDATTAPRSRATRRAPHPRPPGVQPSPLAGMR